jgi:hypothetical protein
MGVRNEPAKDVMDMIDWNMRHRLERFPGNWWVVCPVAIVVTASSLAISQMNSIPETLTTGSHSAEWTIRDHGPQRHIGLMIEGRALTGLLRNRFLTRRDWPWRVCTQGRNT